MKAYAKLAAILAAGAAGVTGFCALVFEKTFHRKDRKQEDAAAAAGESAWMQAHRRWLARQPQEILSIRSADGLKLHAVVYMPEEDAAVTTTGKDRPILLCVHGYHSDGPTDFGALTPFFKKAGYIYCLVDDRGHGKSEGDYVGYGYHDKYDVLQWIEVLRERFGPDVPIYLFGISMGGATVLSCSDMDELPSCVRGIISDCGYSDGWEESRHVLHQYLHLPAFPFMYIFNGLCILRAGFDMKKIRPIDSVVHTKVPILFIHGDKDDFVPTRMGEELYAACGSEHKRFLLVHGAAHAVSYLVSPREYEDTVKEFVETCGQL